MTDLANEIVRKPHHIKVNKLNKIIKRTCIDHGKFAFDPKHESRLQEKPCLLYILRDG